MRRGRHAFTLVELLVAMALIIFIMAILSQAFVAATQVFRDLKSAGDMAEKLRSATGIMRRYLAADHFEGERRLSDPNFWLAPPREGFFRVWHGLPTPAEGYDPSGFCPSYASTTHALHFTVKLRGNQRSDYFSTTVPYLPNGSPSPLPGLLPSAGPSTAQFLWPAQPESRYEDYPATGGGLYNWQWAEVAFFLQATGETANGTQLYALYMRQLLAVPDMASGIVLAVPASQRVPTSQSQIPGYLEVSCHPDPSGTANLYFNSPIDLTMPVRRFGMTAGNLAGIPNQTDPFTGQLTYPRYADETTGNTTMAAADLLLSNVISFDVRLLADPPSATLPDAFEDLFHLASRLPYNSNPFGSPIPPFSTTSGPLVFDTWSNNQDATYTTYSTANIPITVNIRAVQVTLRIWDEKTELTRQITFVQAM